MKRKMNALKCHHRFWRRGLHTVPNSDIKTGGNDDDDDVPVTVACVRD